MLIKLSTLVSKVEELGRKDNSETIEKYTYL